MAAQEEQALRLKGSWAQHLQLGVPLILSLSESVRALLGEANDVQDLESGKCLPEAAHQLLFNEEFSFERSSTFAAVQQMPASLAVSR